MDSGLGCPPADRAGGGASDQRRCSRRYPEIDENYWYAPEDPPPTCRSILGHAELILRADLRYPVILASDGSVMDGMHRILKALMDGRDVIRAVQFATDPEPDFVGRAPAELPY